MIDTVFFSGESDGDFDGFNPDDFAVNYIPESEQPPLDLHGLCQEFFAAGGVLAQSGGVNGAPCEERPQQLAMAQAVAGALDSGSNLCIEAPTGVGKSFAYLVPLIHYAVHSRRPALISTETINLQHQLIDKDLPFLQQLCGVEFKVALAKGRSNYLCRRRLAMLSGEQRDQLLPVPHLAAETERIIRDLERGNDQQFNDGVRGNSAVWSMVCSESGNCAGAKCEFFRNCYYFRARRKWDEADIVVANHALFLTDLAIREECGNGGALLPDYGAVLIDEAHTLENSAASHLGLHLNKLGFIGTMNRLYHPDRARGLLMRSGAEMLELRALSQSVREELYGFFAPYEELLKKNDTSSLRLPEDKPDPFPDRLVDALIKLENLLSDTAENEEDESLKTELSSYRDRCRGMIDAVSDFTSRSVPEAVYYLEEEHDAVTLCASPLNVAELLGKMLFNGSLPVILCSATMTVAGSFDYYRERTGFTGGDMMQLDSPFSPEQAQLTVEKQMPEPDSPEYLEALAEEIYRLVEENDGSAFVLFTSYRSLRFCAAKLRPRFEAHDRVLLEQGGDFDRSTMLRIFKETPHAVLFGADSFWTGVDVPGENLTMVIITRLPFASPGSPVIAARQERLEAAGKSSFAHYSLPEAVLKFRQGVGRLIRNRTDRGRIVILDSRVVTKRYGSQFLRSVNCTGR